MLDDSQVSDPAVMRMLLYGQLISKALSVAVQLGIPERLSDQGYSADALAAEMSLHSVALQRLLRSLVPFNVFSEDKVGKFTLTHLGRTLCRVTPGSVEATALLADDEVGAAWAELEHTIRTGGSAFSKVHGVDFFSYLEKEPVTREIFDRSQASAIRLELDEILEVVDFSSYSQIVDVGGGDGALLCQLLHRAPNSAGVVVDLPGTVRLAEKRIAEETLTHRCRAVEGDFFDVVTPGGDMYVLSHILHDWDDASALSILRTCRMAMPDHGHLMILDLAIDGCRTQESAYRLAGVMDLYMLSIFGVSGGKERTEAEFASLVTRAGLVVDGSRILPSGLAVITASKGDC